MLLNETTVIGADAGIDTSAGGLQNGKSITLKQQNKTGYFIAAGLISKYKSRH